MLHWYALYTKPRREQKVAEQLRQLGFTIYLPLKVEVRQWSDRKKKVISPLFSSYVFICIEESKRDSVFVIDGLLNYVFWLGKPAVIRDEEMEIMQREIDQPNSGVEVTHLQSGDKVELEQGAFKGQNAIVNYVSNQKVHLFLPSLGVKLVISKSSMQL